MDAGTLRLVANWLNEQADKMIAPEAPVIPAPVVTPPVTTPIVPIAGVRQYAFSGTNSRMTIAGVEGGTVAIKFEVPNDWLATGKLTLAETSSSGDAPKYEAWVSGSPGGPSVGPVYPWQYTGGAITFTHANGPWYLGQKLPPGEYWFCIKNTSGSGPFYAQLNM